MSEEEEEGYTGEFKIKNEVGKNLFETYEAKRVSEEIKTILEEMRFKASIYRDHKKRDLSFNDEEKNCALLLDYIQQKENIIKEVREYITSYESIETIQQFDHNKNNKDLDYSTIDEMTRRYMIVHDKILKIIDRG